MKTAARFALRLTLCAGLALLQGPLHAQALSGDRLVDALRHGGYVVVMRHASSPREVPDKQTADAENVHLERQLDAAGRADAVAMGKALHSLKIPVALVLTSPTYRALETARLANLPNPQPVAELGDGGHSMQGVNSAQAAWLRKKVADFPKGTCTFLVTHMPNISAAFPALAAGVADGESLIFGPDGQGEAVLVGRIKIEEWPRLK